MKSHEFGYSASSSETGGNSWDRQTNDEQATNVEKQNSRLSARGLFEKGTVDGRGSEDLSSDALGVRAQRMEIGEGSSVTEVYHVGGPRAGTSETRLALTSENGEQQEITFSQGPDGETKVTIDGKEVTDRGTLDQINAVVGHLREEMSGGVQPSAEQQVNDMPAAEQPAAAVVAPTQEGWDGIVKREGLMDRLRNGPAVEPRAQPQEQPGVTWLADEGNPNGSSVMDVYGNLQGSYRQRRENLDESYAAWLAPGKAESTALSGETRVPEPTQRDIDNVISGAEELLRQSAVKQPGEVGTTENLQKKVAEQVAEDGEGRVDLDDIDTKEVVDRVEYRTTEALNDHAEVDPSDTNIEAIIEDAAKSVEGEHIAKQRRENRVEDARGDVTAFFSEQSPDEDGNVPASAEYKINQETSGAEKGAEGEAVREVAEGSEEAQAEGAKTEVEPDAEQRQSEFSGAFGAVLNSQAGNMLRQMGVNPKIVSERMKSGDLTLTEDIVRQLTEVAKSRQSAVWNQPIYPANYRPKSQLEKAAMDEQEKLRGIAEKLMP